MPLLTGVAFFVCWLMVAVFNVAINKALLVTAIIFIILGLVVDNGAWKGCRHP
jgi:hypothetical protein